MSCIATASYQATTELANRYFIHNEYAGISAFLNEPAPESERNASMLSVGVLVPLEYGRMGKSWLHAEGLKDLARLQIRDIDNTERLEKYWEKHRIQEGERPKGPPLDSPLSYRASASNGQLNGLRRSHGMSDAAALTGALRSLSAHHPALSLTGLIKLFGPLIFPLYRAALLRKRILLVGEPPVRQNCEFGRHSELTQIHRLTIRSLRPLYPVFCSQITLVATTNRWYTYVSITTLVQCWGAGHSPALRSKWERRHRLHCPTWPKLDRLYY